MDRRRVTPQSEPFDEGGLNAPGEAVGVERLALRFRFTEKNWRSDFSDPVTSVAFDDLGIEELCADDPGVARLVRCPNPFSEMGGQGIEGERQAITGKDG